MWTIIVVISGLALAGGPFANASEVIYTSNYATEEACLVDLAFINSYPTQDGVTVVSECIKTEVKVTLPE